MSLIQLDDLTRRYGRRRGIERVSLSVPAGALFGFLGPNGAGKTTTVRVMLGFLRPSSGEARIFGLDCWRDSKGIKRDIGYLPGDLRLPAWIWLVSSFSDRRGRAITLLFLVLLSLFLLNYLARFWHPLEKIAFLSPLHYHRPVNVLGNGAWPWRDMGVLLVSGGAMWLMGGMVFARRDLCTV